MLTRINIIDSILAPMQGTLINYPELRKSMVGKLQSKTNHELADMFLKYTGYHLRPHQSNVFFYY